MGHDARVAAALVVIIGTALFLRLRSSNETIPNRESFSSFPHQLGEWQGMDAAIPSDSLQCWDAEIFCSGGIGRSTRISLLLTCSWLISQVNVRAIRCIRLSTVCPEKAGFPRSLGKFLWPFPDENHFKRTDI